MQNFKDQGNEMVQSKRWKDAKEFYTKGIAVLSSKVEDKWEKPDNEEDEITKMKVLEEQIYVNRALCNLELSTASKYSTFRLLIPIGNYRSTTLDCAAALRINPKNVKAHYRSASALLALDKVHEALDVCYRGLKTEETNVALKSLLKRIQGRAEIMERADRKRRAEQKRKEQEKQMLQSVLATRKVKMRGTSKPPDLEDAEIRLSPDPLSSSSLLEFPVMLLYPTHAQTDFIKAFAEKDWLSHHLSYILPLPWDDKGEFTMSSIDCYMDTISGGLMKVGKNMKLLDVLSNGKTEIVDGLVRIYVVPQARAGQWIEEVKKQKGL